jgi:hypothetical protein
MKNSRELLELQWNSRTQGTPGTPDDRKPLFPPTRFQTSQNCLTTLSEFGVRLRYSEQSERSILGVGRYFHDTLLEFIEEFLRTK